MKRSPLPHLRSLTIAASLALLGATAPAIASPSPTTDPGSATDTGTSGNTGKAANVQIGSVMHWGLRAVTWWERNNRPCKLRLSARSLEDGQQSVTFTGNTLDICGGNPGASSMRNVNFDANPRYFVRGIAACTTDKNDSANNRLKGIKIYPARVTRQGAVTPLNSFEKVERNNCKFWHPPVHCPAGHIAYGVRVHHNGDSFRGLGLRCRKVVK
jgi:hypothetical protein